MKGLTTAVSLCLIVLGFLANGCRTLERVQLDSALSRCKTVRIYSYFEDRQIDVSDPLDRNRLKNAIDRSITDESREIASLPDENIARITYVFVPAGRAQNRELLFNVHPGDQVSFVLSLHEYRAAEMTDFCKAVRLIAQKNGLRLGVNETD